MPRQANRSTKYDLVSFGNPPVAEVALGVQFAADTVDVEAFGLFAHKVRGDLPRRQRQPVVPPNVERFDLVPTMSSIEIRLEAPTSLPRTWFLSDDEIQLVQLQHDRLTLNWRETAEAAAYPRYDQLRDRFTALFGLLEESVRDAGQTIEINLVEVTYVNPIEVASGKGTSHPDLSKILKPIRAQSRDSFLPTAEDAQLHARWRIPGDTLGRPGVPVGRLYVSASPSFRPPKNAPIYIVHVMGRVIPIQADLDSAMDAMDLAHEWVVLGFKDLTTAQMHRQWGMKEGPE